MINSFRALGLFFVLIFLTACTEQGRDDFFGLFTGSDGAKPPIEDLDDKLIEDEAEHLNWFLQDVEK